MPGVDTHIHSCGPCAVTETGSAQVRECFFCEQQMTPRRREPFDFAERWVTNGGVEFREGVPL